jgi:hypothetical protein
LGGIRRFCRRLTQNQPFAAGWRGHTYRNGHRRNDPLKHVHLQASLLFLFFASVQEILRKCQKMRMKSVDSAIIDTLLHRFGAGPPWKIQ